MPTRDAHSRCPLEAPVRLISLCVYDPAVMSARAAHPEPSIWFVVAGFCFGWSPELSSWFVVAGFRFGWSPELSIRPVTALQSQTTQT